MIFTKKIALMAAGVALAAPVFYGANTVTTHASSMRFARVTRTIKVYRFIWGGNFANSRLGKGIWLTPGRHIHIKPFYQMGKDGYMLHVSGHGTRTYYARTNSTSWFRY
ncbi:hypothetical protein [Lentilactobacillus buchneri]|uniref:hypothetical protein n=1 Tax=Lentilactobacillus buchneri TaxID=1581 RepID=UPI0020BF8629|nr:hypothetical protein [Lentilactobacillus buchneri]